jgi:hypothetical protein
MRIKDLAMVFYLKLLLTERAVEKDSKERKRAVQVYTCFVRSGQARAGTAPVSTDSIASILEHESVALALPSRLYCRGLIPNFLPTTAPSNDDD